MTGQVTALVALAGAVLLLGLLVSLVLGRRSGRRAARARTASPPPRPARARPSAPGPPVARGAPGRIPRPRSGSRSPSPACAARSSSTAATAAASRSTPPSRSSVATTASRRPPVTGSSRSRSPASSPGRRPRRVPDPGRPRPRRRPGLRARHLHQRGARCPHLRRDRRRVLDRMDGAVVVLHDASSRSGSSTPSSPARASRCRSPRRCARSGWPAGRCARPTTRCARSPGTPAAPTSTRLRAGRRPHRGRPAAADARVLRPAAALPVRAAPDAGAGRRPDPATRRSRCARAPTAGWRRCWRGGGCPPPPPGEIDAQRYLDTVTAALADGRLLGGEAQTLARLGRVRRARRRRRSRRCTGDSSSTCARPRSPTHPDDRADPAAADGGRRARPGRRTSTSCVPPRRRTWWRPARCRCPRCRRPAAVPRAPTRRPGPVVVDRSARRARRGRSPSGRRVGMAVERAQLRVSDAERQAAADSLGAAFRTAGWTSPSTTTGSRRLRRGDLRRPRPAVHRPAPPARPPFPPYRHPPPATRRCRPAGTRRPAGPVGEVRGTGLQMLLFVVTLGIWGYVYFFQTHDEMKRHSGEGIGGVLALMVSLFARIVSPFLLSHEVGGLYERERQAAAGQRAHRAVVLPRHLPAGRADHLVRPDQPRAQRLLAQPRRPLTRCAIGRRHGEPVRAGSSPD